MKRKYRGRMVKPATVQRNKGKSPTKEVRCSWEEKGRSQESAFIFEFGEKERPQDLGRQGVSNRGIKAPFSNFKARLHVKGAKVQYQKRKKPDDDAREHDAELGLGRRDAVKELTGESRSPEKKEGERNLTCGNGETLLKTEQGGGYVKKRGNRCRKVGKENQLQVLV